MSANPANPEWDQIHGFLHNVADIRRRARKHIHQRAVRADQSADSQAILRLLNAALATELACVQRYRGYAAMDAVSAALRDDFMKHAQEEQGHVERIAARILELGGEPRLGPPPGQAVGAEDESLTDMLAEDLIAERIAIATYREIIGFLGEQDPPTRQLFEAIVTVEQEHAEGLVSLRDSLRRPDTGITGSHPLSARLAEQALAEQGLAS